MKTILITTILLLLVSCGQGPRPSTPDLEKCIAGSEPACAQLPGSVVDEEEPTPVVEEPVVEEPVVEEPVIEPIVQPVVQTQWTPSLSGQGDIGYTDVLYINKFSLFLYNFENTNTINSRFEVVFKSSNTRNVPNVGKRYARAFFKNGDKVRIELVDADTDVITNVWRYEWTLHDDWSLTINNNDLGTQLKTEEQALFGVWRWDHNIEVKDREVCEYFLVFVTNCVWIYRSEPISFKYYYE